MIVLKATPMRLAGKERLFTLDLERDSGTLCAVERLSFQRQDFLLVTSPALNEQGVLQAMALRVTK